MKKIWDKILPAIKKAWKAVAGVFRNAWGIRMGRILLIAAAALLLAAAGSFIWLWNEGTQAGSNAQTLLEQYEQSIEDTRDTEDTQTGVQTPPAPEQSGNDGAVLTPTAEKIPDMLEGYPVMGKLDIPALELELPVISEMTSKALKVSVCYYQGPQPDEAGSFVITGHNYADGSHFGRLDKLKAGDPVTYTALDGQKYAYEVYETVEVTPDDEEALEEFEGERVLTLLTCSSHGNRRLIVRCRPV